MKRIKNYILYVFALLAIVACEDESKNPHPEIPNGAMVLLDEVTTPVFNVTEIATATYEGVFRDPVGNVQSITLRAYLSRGSSVLTDTAVVKVITDVNGPFVISTQELVDAWSANSDITSTDSLLAGDRIDFYNMVTSVEGETWEPEDIGPDLAGNPGQRSAFRFTTFISCPFDAAEAAGTYSVISDGWGDWAAGETLNITANEDGSGIIIEGLYSKFAPAGTSYDVEVLVNATTGAATVAQQPAWECDWYGSWCVWGQATVDGGGWVFSCSGTITLTLTHRVSAGSFGSYTINLGK